MATIIKTLSIRHKPVLSGIMVPVITRICDFDNNKTQLTKARARFDAVCSADIRPRIKKITEYEIDTVRVREYFTTPASPYVVFFHGGGYVLGGLKSHDIFCRRLTKYCRLNVISVAYSLAPEAKFPTQLIEGRKVIREVRKKHGDKIFLCGDSAGGNMVAALSAEFDNLCGQLLFHPVIDAQLKNASVDTNGTRKNFLTARMLRWFRDQYVPRGTSYDTPQLSPYRLSNKTPTFIAVGERDPLLDDAKQYVDALTKQGTDCTFIIATNTLHGFMQQPKQFGYKKVLDELNVFLKS
jgi:acetyl esterase